MYTEKEIQDRVTEGVAFLDAAYGDEWVHKIDLDILDIGNSSVCLGAQIEGSYSEFQNRHDIYGDFTVSRGFDMYWASTDERDTLNKVWRERITDIKAETE